MSTAQAPVKTMLQIPSAKWQREIQPGLEALGFHFLGEDSTGHAIFQHPSAGQVRLSKTLSGDQADAKRQALGRARRLLALRDSEAQEFLVYMREMYGILPHEAKQLRLNMMEEIQQWARRAKPKMNATAIRAALRDSPFVETVEHQKGARRADYIIYGSEAITPEDLHPGVQIAAIDAEAARQRWMDQLAEQGGAVAWLSQLLATDAVLTTDIEANAKRANLAWGSVTRAADDLGVIREKEAVYQGGTYWRLPAAPEIADYTPSTNGSTPTAQTAPTAPVAPTAPTAPTAPQPEKAPPPTPKPEPPREPTREPEPEPAKQAAPAATPGAPARDAPGDLLTQITSLVERAGRADEAEAQAAVALEELHGLSAQLDQLAAAVGDLQVRVRATITLITP